jgi:hypothetical protein
MKKLILMLGAIFCSLLSLQLSASVEDYQKLNELTPTDSTIYQKTTSCKIHRPKKHGSCKRGHTGPTGPNGLSGRTGPTGPTGPTGTAESQEFISLILRSDPITITTSEPFTVDFTDGIQTGGLGPNITPVAGGVGLLEGVYKFDFGLAYSTASGQFEGNSEYFFGLSLLTPLGLIAITPSYTEFFIPLFEPGTASRSYILEVPADEIYVVLLRVGTNRTSSTVIIGPSNLPTGLIPPDNDGPPGFWVNVTQIE